MKAVSHDFTYQERFYTSASESPEGEMSDVNAFGNAHPEDNAEGDPLELFPMTREQRSFLPTLNKYYIIISVGCFSPLCKHIWLL